MTQRSPAVQEAYDQSLATGETLIETDREGRRFLNWEKSPQLITEYHHWVIIPNQFPYDMVCVRHDLLLAKRHVARLGEATDDERQEYYRILKELDCEGHYQSLIGHFSNKRSLPEHFHVHLVTWKDYVQPT